MLKILTIFICDMVALITSSVSLIITVVFLSAFLKNDPSISDTDPKRLFLGILGSLIITLTCAGIRSLYNEETTKVRGSNEGTN